MGKIKDASLQTPIATGEPVTHFFYEYQGECSVEPLLLIENGITLWHEHVFADEVCDNSFLWDLAKSILECPQGMPHYSWVEWVRYRITTGAYVPAHWKSPKPFPHKGLLIAAIYFQEARRLCIEGPSGRAWHLIALAYYHLGLNTGSSTRQNTSKAAQMMHAGRTEKVRALVLAALDIIKKSGTAASVDAAKEQVVDLLRKKAKTKPGEAPKSMVHSLNEFDTLVPERTKGRSEAKNKNDVFVRIRNMLDTWALPSGPYPDIAEAFSHFRKKRGPAIRPDNGERSTSEGVPTADSDYHLRLINFCEDGSVLTVTVKRNENEDV